MHPDAMPLRSRYPILSLWFSWQRQILALQNSTTTTLMRLETQIMLNNAYINSKGTTGRLAAGGFGSHDAMWIQSSAKSKNDTSLPRGYRLYHSEDAFFGEIITGTEGMSSWFLERDDTALPTITQFVNDIKPRADICTDIYRQNITFYSPYLGTFILERSPTRTKIVSAVFSPNYGWVAILDEERYIALYQLNAPERIYTDSFENVVALDQRLKAPDDLDLNRVALSFIDNKGKYFYADAVSWRNGLC